METRRHRSERVRVLFNGPQLLTATKRMLFILLCSEPQQANLKHCRTKCAGGFAADHSWIWLSAGSPENEANTFDAKRYQEKRGNVLRVTYATQGDVIYRRSRTGNLGSEIVRGVEEPVLYSESSKALVSPKFNLCLPVVVVDWLQGSCLAVLYSTQPKGVKQPGFDETSTWEEWDDAVGGTPSNGSCLLYRFEYALGGCILLEECKVNGVCEQVEELIYSVSDTSWISPRHDQCNKNKAIVAQGVDTFIKRAAQYTKTTVWNHFRKEYAMSPWFLIPDFAKAEFPQPIVIFEVGGVILDYDFQQPRRLLEAMSHPTITHTASDNYQRLSVCGSALMETLVLSILLSASPLTVSAYASNNLSPDGIVTRRPSGTRATVGTADELRGWAPEGDAETKVDSPNLPWMFDSADDVSCAFATLCNHDMYARACVRMGVYKYIVHRSENLGQAIADYAAALHRAEGIADVIQTEDDMLRHDAPRVLGDVFLACAGADWF